MIAQILKAELGSAWCFAIVAAAAATAMIATALAPVGRPPGSAGEAVV